MRGKRRGLRRPFGARTDSHQHTHTGTIMHEHTPAVMAPDYESAALPLSYWPACAAATQGNATPLLTKSDSGEGKAEGLSTWAPLLLLALAGGDPDRDSAEKACRNRLTWATAAADLVAALDRVIIKPLQCRDVLARERGRA